MDHFIRQQKFSLLLVKDGLNNSFAISIDSLFQYFEYIILLLFDLQVFVFVF